MSQINFGAKEISCKIVYYGPGMSGKTTNLEIIHQKAPKDHTGDMVSIATESDRTLYFDYLPMDLGSINGLRIKMQLYTVPGQIYYNATRKLVLQGADGVVFVADSHPNKQDENMESLRNLEENLKEMGLSFQQIPCVIQLNKRDLPDAMSVEEMKEALDLYQIFNFTQATAKSGNGVFATLKQVSQMVIENIQKQYASSKPRRSVSNPQYGSEDTRKNLIPNSSDKTPIMVDKNNEPREISPSIQQATQHENSNLPVVKTESKPKLIELPVIHVPKINENTPPTVGPTIKPKTSVFKHPVTPIKTETRSENRKDGSGPVPGTRSVQRHVMPSSHRGTGLPQQQRGYSTPTGSPLPNTPINTPGVSERPPYRIAPEEKNFTTFLARYHLTPLTFSLSVFMFLMVSYLVINLVKR